MSLRVGVAVLTVGVAVLTVAGCGDGDTQQGSNDLPPVEAREREAGDPEVQSTGEVLVPQPGNFLTDPGAAREAIDAITSELGPILVTSFDLYDQYAIFEAQDPAKPENLDTYTFREGKLGEPVPVHVTNSTLEDLPNRLFSLAEVNWDAVASLAETAVTQLQIEDGVVNHLGVDRGFGSPDIRMSLSVGGPRRSGSVEASADGTVLSAQLF
jgi:hypothetical protein